MPETLRLFVPITKVDAVQRMVYGIAAAEEPDKSGEIFDFESSVPHFKDWSEQIAKATDGKSVGNVRAMHGKVSAGVLKSIDFDPVAKQIPVSAYINDDAEWKKTTEGNYTGFSIGGDYVRKWADGEFKRYEARPSEISLVDNPCIPSATFQMVKADGTTEERPLVGRTLRQVWACGAADGCMHDAKADAVKCDGGPMEKRDFSQEQRDKMAETGTAKTALPAGVQKCLYQIAALAGALNSIEWVHDAEEAEAAQEADGSPVPDKIKAGISALYDALVAMVEEEAAEWNEEEGGEMAMSVASTLEKVCSKPDRLRELLAKRAEQEDYEMKPEELQKVVGATEEKLAKIMSDGIAGLTKVITDNETAHAAKFEKIEADLKLIKDNTPEKSEIAKREPPIEKNKDTRDTDPPKSKEPETVLELTKRALSPENAYQIGG